MKSLLPTARQYRERVIGHVLDAEQQRQQMVGWLGQHLDVAVHTAAGIDVIGWHASLMADDIARMAAVMNEALPAIIELLAQNAQELGIIAHMLANPRKTAGAELFRDGSYALASGWVDEAVEDLTRAVEQARYHQAAWFNLGVALQRQSNDLAAADAFSKCVRYAAQEAPALAATAALLASALYRENGSAEKSEQVLRVALPHLDRCAEIHLALAVHHGGSPEHLMRALRLKPVLAADALAANAPDLERIAAQVCQQAGGPVWLLRQLEFAYSSAFYATQAAGVQDVAPIPSAITLPEKEVDALLLAEAALPQAIAVSRQLDAEIRAAIDRLRNAARLAQERVVVTRNRSREHIDTVRASTQERVRATETDASLRVAAIQTDMQAAIPDPLPYGVCGLDSRLPSVNHVFSKWIRLSNHQLICEKMKDLGLADEVNTYGSWIRVRTTGSCEWEANVVVLFNANDDPALFDVMVVVPSELPGARHLNLIIGGAKRTWSCLQIDDTEQFFRLPVGRAAQDDIRRRAVENRLARIREYREEVQRVSLARREAESAANRAIAEARRIADGIIAAEREAAQREIDEAVGAGERAVAEAQNEAAETIATPTRATEILTAPLADLARAIEMASRQPDRIEPFVIDGKPMVVVQ